MNRSVKLALSLVFTMTTSIPAARAQSFGRDAEAARLAKTGQELVREEERIGKYKTWLKEQFDTINRREADYQRSAAMLKQAVSRFRCPNGLTLGGCLASPPVCSQAREFRARAMTFAEQLDREKRAINVERQRLNGLNRSLTTQVNAYNQRLERYKGDRQDFNRRYSGDGGRNSDDGQLFFDDSAPKARPR